MNELPIQRNLARPDFEVSFAASEADIHAAQRLRYQVFVDELGGDGPLVDHDARREEDAYDRHASHLLLRDRRLNESEQVVGVYRLMDQQQAAAAGGFVSSLEYDLTALESSGRRLLELGRSCVHPRYRGGTALFQLWQGLAAYVLESQTEVLFGVASFHGTDIAALARPLSFLHHHYRAPEALRTYAKGAEARDMAILGPDEVDRRSALPLLPPLIKAYLRLGGTVGDGAYLDHAFNTTDVCMILDMAALSPQDLAVYGRQQA